MSGLPLEELSKKLGKIGFNIKFNESDVSFKSLKEKLSEISKDSDACISELKNVKLISTEEMIKAFPTNICCG